MPHLITTLGLKSESDLGFILPHEHIFVDLRQGFPPDYAQAEAADVVALMQPEIEKAREVGVTALVECTPVGVGRRVDFVEAVSKAANFPVVVPTGTYREPNIPQWILDASEDALCDWMLSELQGTIEDTNIQAAWIKLSAGDNGLTEGETKVLRAAARAGKATNAVIGSHTIRGSVVRNQLDIIEAQGYTAGRFIWIHTQAEPDLSLHLEMAKRGAWIEYDWIGGQDFMTDAEYIKRIQMLLDAGFENQILLSHDRGWYDAGKRDFVPKPFTYISQTFIPAMRDAGISDATIHKLTHDNPFRAFAR